jgi:hypothetical protein
LLSFASVYFFESGLFNGLQPIQIKKFPAVLRLAASGCAQGHFRRHVLHFLAAHRGATSIWRVGKLIAQILDSGKKLRIKNPAGSRRIDFNTRLPSSGYFRGRRTKETAEARWTEFDLDQSHSEQPTSSAF